MVGNEEQMIRIVQSISCVVAGSSPSSPTVRSRTRNQEAGPSRVWPLLFLPPGEGAGAVARGAGSISFTFAGHRLSQECDSARSRGAHTFIPKVQVPVTESVQRMRPHDSGFRLSHGVQDLPAITGRNGTSSSLGSGHATEIPARSTLSTSAPKVPSSRSLTL